MDQRLEVPDFVVFRTVFYYCFMILVVPVTIFFFTKFIIFDGIFGMSFVTSSVYAAVLAIIVLHVALGFYIYKAYNDTTPLQPSKPDKQD